MRSRARIVDDIECERQLLGYLGQHPRVDLAALCGAFPWSKQSISDLLSRLTREWRICWRMVQQPLRNGRRSPCRVYWIAPPDLALSANPNAAASRLSQAMKPSANATTFYFHTGTLIEDAGRIQMLAVQGRAE